MGKDTSIRAVTRRWLGRPCLRPKRVLSNPSIGLQELQLGVCLGNNKRMNKKEGALVINCTGIFELCTINSLQKHAISVIIQQIYNNNVSSLYFTPGDILLTFYSRLLACVSQREG